MTIKKLEEIENEIERDKINITPNLNQSLVIFVCFISLTICLLVLIQTL